MNRNPYTILGWIALFVMPLSASINFGWYAYTGMLSLGVAPGLAKAGGISLAVGLELLGILAGHLAILSYSIRNYTYLGITATATVLYVAVGTFEMIDIPFARFVPLLASCLYVLVGIQSEIDEAVARAATNQKRSQVIDYRQQEAQAQRDHEARLKQMELDAQAKLALETKHEDNETAVKLARIEAKKEAAATVSNSFPMKPEETEGNKKETMKRIWQPGMKPTELAKLTGVSKGYASKYINNGAMAEYASKTN